MRTGGFSRNARLAFDARRPAARLEDDDALNAPTNRDDDDDEMSSSSPSDSSESPPPLSSALAVPSRLLARLSPRRVAEHRAFRHLARAARRLDLVASMRARRAETTRHLKRAWVVAIHLAEKDPTIAPNLTLLAESLFRDEKANDTFSRLKRDAREGLRDAAARLRVFAAKNAFAAEALLDLAEYEARVFATNDATENAESSPISETRRKSVERIISTSGRFSELTDVFVRFHQGLSRVELRLAERAFAALAGADPRAKAFAPSAETLFRDETKKMCVFFSGPGSVDGDVAEATKTRTSDPGRKQKKNHPQVTTIRRPFVYPERAPITHVDAIDDVERSATKSADPSLVRSQTKDDDRCDCFSQSEPLTSSRRISAMENDVGAHGSVRLETVDFLDQAVRATQTQSR